MRAIDVQGRMLRGRAAILSTGDEDAPRHVKLQIATRQLGPHETQALHARIVRLCGFPSLSMGILASAFRAIRRLAPEARNAGRNYVAGIGLDMGLRDGDSLLFQNLTSVVPIGAGPEELEDRDELVRTLSRQLRDRLGAKIDLGALRLNAVFSRRPRHIQWVVEHLLRYSYSLWYAYFGSLDSVGDQFCGAEIESVFYAGPSWSPLGLSLLVNQHRGRLFFQATYDPELVPEPLAQAFLDETLADLRDEAEAIARGEVVSQLAR
jgi:hypothetical protein